MCTNAGDITAIKKLLEKKISYTLTIFNHPDRGINIAGLLLEQRKRKEEGKLGISIS